MDDNKRDALIEAGGYVFVFILLVIVIKVFGF